MPLMVTNLLKQFTWKKYIALCDTYYSRKIDISKTGMQQAPLACWSDKPKPICFCEAFTQHATRRHFPGIVIETYRLMKDFCWPGSKKMRLHVATSQTIIETQTVTICCSLLISNHIKRSMLNVLEKQTSSIRTASSWFSLLSDLLGSLY